MNYNNGWSVVGSSVWHIFQKGSNLRFHRLLPIVYFGTIYSDPSWYDGFMPVNQLTYTPHHVVRLVDFFDMMNCWLTLSLF